MASGYRVMVRCPATGQMVDSGMRTSGREVLSSGLFQNGVMFCPHCRENHPLGENSFLDADPQASVGGLWRPNR